MTDADWPWLQAEQARALAEPDDAPAQFEAAWPRWPAPAAEPGWRTQLGLHLAELLLRLWRFDELEPLLPALHDAAQALGYGERLALIPQLADPKNLFGTLLQDAANMACVSGLLAA